MNTTTIQIREQVFENNIFQVIVTFYYADGNTEEIPTPLQNPFNEKTDQLLEEYFEEHIRKPYDDIPIQDAPKAIEEYGIQLFQQLFEGEASFHYRTLLQEATPENIVFEIIGKTPAFQSIYWESLRNPKSTLPLAAEGAIFRRKNTKSKTVKAIVYPSPTINLLIVTARPNEAHDVNYRTIQRLLVDLIQKAKLKVKPHILRPGTYESFVRHLDKVGAKYYHIIHFDLHGALLDYSTYEALQKEAAAVTFTNWSFQNTDFQGTYALPELSAYKDKKAFLFFESNKKGTAIPVEAGQLATLLENKQVPVVLLNACQSAKQDNSEHETSLGQVLIQKGIQLVLAMRYSVSVSAARILMKALYQKLYEGEAIEKAIAAARKDLYRNSTRQAAFNHQIELQDWLLPVVYQNGHPNFRLRPFTTEEEIAFANKNITPSEIRQVLPHGFFGRDLDILLIEKTLLTRNNILLLRGMGGAGKTTLLKYLAAWWLKTGFIQKVFYFGYELKAFTLANILRTIGQSIYHQSEHEQFRLLPEQVQQQRIIDALNTNEYALILDNAESITGVNLAIKNTLTESQRSELKQFLTDLKGGKSYIIIGSRSPEEWLKNGTFGSSQLNLGGLDEESAKNFADAIIKDLGIPIEYIAKDEHFERLLKLLDGFPLALKAILPNLENKTAKVILEELEKGLEGLDTGKMGDKTESIVKCIEYAYSNLSEDAQKLLMIFRPFQSIMNVAPKIVNLYIGELKKTSTFRQYPFHKLNIVINELEIAGLVSISGSTSTIQFLKFQPLFSHFLKDLFKNLDSLKQLDLDRAFIACYEIIGASLSNQLRSKNPKLVEIGLLISERELENFRIAIDLLLRKGQSIANVYRPIFEYFFKKLHYQKCLDFFIGIQKQIEAILIKNNIDQLSNHIIIMELIGNIYLKMNLLDKADITFNKELSILESNSNLIDGKNFELKKANIFQNLGIVKKQKRKYVESEKLYLKSLEIYQKYRLIERLAEVNQNIGNIKRLQEKFLEAQEYFKAAIKVFEQLKDDLKIAENHHNLGLVASHLKKYNKAELFFIKALKTYEKFDDTLSKAEVCQDLGGIFLEMVNLEQAKKYFDLALIYFLGNDYQQGKILLNLGIIALKKENFSEADSYLLKSLEIALRAKDYWDTAKILSNLHQVMKKTNDNSSHKKAWEYIQLQFREKDIEQLVECVEKLALSKID